MSKQNSTGTVWSNSDDPSTYAIIMRSDAIEEAMDKVLSVNITDQNLLYRLSKEKNQALGFSIFIINKNIPGMLGTAHLDGKTYICPLEDFGLVVTASVYASLVKIFADCNPEKAQECKRRQHTIEKLIQDLIFWF